MKAKQKFRLEGKFVGGGWWESNRTFDSEQEAFEWHKEFVKAYPTNTQYSHLKAVKVEVENEHDV